MAKKKITIESTGKTAAYAAVGRRKRAVAKVRFYIGAGENTINGKPAVQACQTVLQKKKTMLPLTLAGLTDQYHYSAKVVGGGVNGQIDAVMHAVARSIGKMSEALNTTMSQNGLLTRDPREKERKKYYRVRARKMPQFAKR